MVEDRTMHLALADTALYNMQERYKSTMQENLEALKYYTNSVELMNGKLNATINVASDNIINTVMGMAGYDLRTLNFNRWLTHMNGLQKMIQGRGGLKALNSTHLEMMVSWSDIVGCLALDITPRFEAFAIPVDQAQLHIISPTLNSMITSLYKRSPELSDICQLLIELSLLVELISDKALTQWYNQEDWLRTLGRVLYYILQLPRYETLNFLDTVAMGRLEIHEVIRLASIMFLSAPVGCIGGNGDIILTYRGRLPRLLRSQTLDWTSLEELQLWVLIVDALVENEEHRQWILLEIKIIMLRNGFTWERVLHIIREIAWLDNIFSEDLEKLERELLQ
ncbi:hypothetical protein F5884DRAFT_749701 [Xylogone sp. PMI_703]|nr:hypothetical protein F5884DRAFT_749701 [Xylogone sp. PMI_703]